MAVAQRAGAVTPASSSRINEFAIKLANVNGSGSSSANTLLMRAIFRMGVPVSGKNLFPSNIQGLPTWYEIRVSGRGYAGRVNRFDLVVAMNTQTYAHDIGEVLPGGHLLFDSSWPLDPDLLRDDITCLPLPVARLCSEQFRNPRTRVLLQNIAYAGAVVALLDIDVEVVAGLLAEQYAGKTALVDANQAALRLGHDYARDHFECPLPGRVEPLQATADSMLLDGNTAAALGCVYAGATVAAWYPITPSTSLMDGFAQFCKQYRHDSATGRNDYLVLQAEDEIAAMGMVIGAGWMGARAFTSTSGPGLSLMSELIGLAYFAEIPAVLIDVQRTGPSTGMPTRTQQADILTAAYASHGDTRHVLLFPGNPAECFDFAVQSFDLAERLQTPVIMLSDLDIGMNDWVVPKLTWDAGYTPDRGRVLSAGQLERIERFQRYAQPDAEGITARTLPGSSARGAYFTRGSGHNRLGGYTEDPDEYREVVDRLARKHRAAAAHLPAPVIVRQPGARIGIVTVGSGDPAAREAADLLAASGIAVDYLRVRGFPFGSAVTEFLEEHEPVFVVEQNRDAQLRSLLLLETPVSKERLRSVLVYGGMPITATEIVDGIRDCVGR